MKRKTNGEVKRRPRPSIDPEIREQQLISAAVDLAEQQLLDGTASAAVITHYLKLGTMREKLERERLVQENKLIDAKISTMESTKRAEELYAEVLTAMKRYNGYSEDEY